MTVSLPLETASQKLCFQRASPLTHMPWPFVLRDVSHILQSENLATSPPVFWLLCVEEKKKRHCVLCLHGVCRDFNCRVKNWASTWSPCRGTSAHREWQMLPGERAGRILQSCRTELLTAQFFTHLTLLLLLLFSSFSLFFFSPLPHSPDHIFLRRGRPPGVVSECREWEDLGEKKALRLSPNRPPFLARCYCFKLRETLVRT